MAKPLVSDALWEEVVALRRATTARLARGGRVEVLIARHILAAPAGWSERTLAWLNRFRRLRVRNERRADIHQAFLTPGCALICHHHRQRFCWMLLVTVV